MTLTHLVDALSDTCSLERGTIFDPVVLAGVACMVCPPEDIADTSSLRLLVSDTEHVIRPGWRVVYGGVRHVVTKLATETDGLTELICHDFAEPA